MCERAASKMAEWKVAIVRAFAEAIFPSVKEDAILARQAGKEGLAKLMEIDGASMEFVTAAVSFEAFAWVLLPCSRVVYGTTSDTCWWPHSISATKGDMASSIHSSLSLCHAPHKASCIMPVR